MSTASSLPPAYSALSLYGKVALITGGSSGIGAATARLFAARGAKVMIASRRKAENEKVIESIRKAGGEAFSVECDVSIESDIKAAVEATVSKYGRLDIAFNNAGIMGEMLPTHQQTSEHYQKVMDINVKGVFLCMKYEVEEFFRQAEKDGLQDVTKLDHKRQPNDYFLNSNPYSIINNASFVGSKVYPNLSSYCSSKAAVQAMTKVAALDYAKKGIRVNCINYGYVISGISEKHPAEALVNNIPMGRMGQGAEAAEVAAFLGSNAASFVTGAMVSCEGGVMAG